MEHRADRPCRLAEPSGSLSCCDVSHDRSRNERGPRNRWAIALIGASLALCALPASASAAVMSYDRAKAVAYATANYNKVVSDGYFWINSGTCKYYGAGASVPTGTGIAGGVGDDCAHFVSSCIGAPSGAGIPVHQPFANSSTTSYKKQYGDPSAGGLASWLVSSGNAVYLTSTRGMASGDVIAYDWNGNGSIDHIVLYMGNGLISAHAASHLNVAYDWAQSSNPNEILTYIHITVPSAIVPEPAAMAGLAMTGAMLRRSRKRRVTRV